MVESTFSKLTTWLFIILFLLIFTWAFFASDKGFMSQAANIALSFGDWFLPAEPKEELKQFKDLPKAIINTQNAVKATIDVTLLKSKDKICLVELPYLGDLKDFGLELINQNDYVNSKIIQKSGPGYLAKNPVSIDNAKICLVNTKNFYDCYIAPERNCAGNIYNDIESVKIYNKKISIDNEEYGLAPYIINLGQGRFCLIPTHSHYLKRHCDADEKTLDNNCLSQIKDIPACS